MTRHRRARRCGFTLIELLAVVAILLLLLSLLLPALKRARDMAMDTRCKSSLRQMGAMMYNFAQDHEGILPIGGSIGGQHGSLPWQQCWMGKEVLVGTAYDAATSFKNTSWPEGKFGTLFEYLGNDAATAKKLYRCIGQPEGVLGSGEGSNGYFDYSMIMAFSGAVLSLIPTRATLEYNTGVPSTWQAKPTPLVVEEDPYWWLNSGANMEPGHGNRDKIGVWHYGHGNYVAANGSVNECKPLAPETLNPDLNNWYVAGPSGTQVPIGFYPGFGTWPTR
jgi:prepilin-type N-terminal cleavage/methylation domain-containing protein